MKIVIICTGYDYEFPHPACGGSEACTEKLAFGLKNRNIDFSIICPKREIKKDYPFQIIETEDAPIRYDKNSRFQKQAAEIAIKLNPDLVITQNPVDELKLLKCPIILNNHGGGDGNMGGDLYLENNNIYHRFISKTQLERCLKNLPQIKDKSILIETSLNEEDFIFNEKREYYLWCASLFWGFQAKGLDLFIKLAQLFPNENFLCYGMGTGEIENYLKNEVELKLKNFKFGGFLDRYKDHSQVFSKAKAFCQFSRLEESFGRTTVEALSKGVPIIHFGTGATTELVDQYGVLVQSNEDFMNCLKNADLLDKKEIFNYAKNKFHVNIEIDKILNFYNNLK